MASPLPPHVQLKLEQTLAQWRQWQCQPALECAPAVVTTLGSGIGNFSVLVEAGRQFVVRIDGLNPAANGLSRQTEWRTLLEAHRAGLAPRPRYFNPDLGSLVCDYLPHDKEQGADLADVAHLLRDIHQLPDRHHRLDLAERIRRYENMLAHRHDTAKTGVMDCQDRMKALLREVAGAPATTALCHNDLLRANRVYSGGKLWALDWEYCAMGSPLYDLAVIIHGDALDPGEATELVEAYLGNPADTATLDSLYAYGCIYRYLELLWYQALDKPMPEGQSAGEKLSELEDMLD
jgi:thiamine kinase-like enzyme